MLATLVGSIAAMGPLTTMNNEALAQQQPQQQQLDGRQIVADTIAVTNRQATSQMKQVGQTEYNTYWAAVEEVQPNSISVLFADCRPGEYPISGEHIFESSRLRLIESYEVALQGIWSWVFTIKNNHDTDPLAVGVAAKCARTLGQPQQSFIVDPSAANNIVQRTIVIQDASNDAGGSQDVDIKIKKQINNKVTIKNAVNNVAIQVNNAQGNASITATQLSQQLGTVGPGGRVTQTQNPVITNIRDLLLNIGTNPNDPESAAAVQALATQSQNPDAKIDINAPVFKPLIDKEPTVVTEPGSSGLDLGAVTTQQPAATGPAPGPDEPLGTLSGPGLQAGGPPPQTPDCPSGQQYSIPKEQCIPCPPPRLIDQTGTGECGPEGFGEPTPDDIAAAAAAKTEAECLRIPGAMWTVEGQGGSCSIPPVGGVAGAPPGPVITDITQQECEGRNGVWNPDNEIKCSPPTCNADAGEILTVSADNVWSCVKGGPVSTEPCPNQGEYRDPNTGKCVATPAGQDCGPNQVWNPNENRCVPISEPVPRGCPPPLVANPDPEADEPCIDPRPPRPDPLDPSTPQTQQGPTQAQLDCIAAKGEWDPVDGCDMSNAPGGAGAGAAAPEEPDCPEGQIPEVDDDGNFTGDCIDDPNAATDATTGEDLQADQSGGGDFLGQEEQDKEVVESEIEEGEE